MFSRWFEWFKEAKLPGGMYWFVGAGAGAGASAAGAGAAAGGRYLLLISETSAAANATKANKIKNFLNEEKKNDCFQLKSNRQCIIQLFQI